MNTPLTSLQKQHQILLELARSPILNRGDEQAGFRLITESAARALRVERVSVWLFSDDHAKILCRDLYELGKRRHSNGEELLAADYPTYFGALDRHRMITIDDVEQDPVAREFLDTYTRPLGISSALDAPVWSVGDKVGIVCHEHVGKPRKWSPEEQNFAASMADFVALLLEAKRRVQTEEALRESEARFRSLVEQIPAATYIAALDEQGSTTFISPQIEAFLGFSPTEWLASPDLWLQRVHPDDTDRVLAELARSKTSDEPLDLQYRILDRAGRTRWFHDKASVVRDEEGNAICIQGVAFDVTDHVEAEGAQRRTERRYQTLMEQAPDGIFLADREGKLLEVNSRAAAMAGSSKEALLDTNLKEILSAGEVADRLLAVADLAPGRTLVQEGFLRRQDGGRVPVEVSVSVVGEDIQAIARDLTERQRSEKELHERGEQLRQAQKMEAIGTLAGGVAHDFNNILTVIMGYADLVRKQLPAGDPSRESIEAIRLVAGRAASLTRQLLAFSRRQTLHPLNLDLNIIVTGLEDMIRRLIREDIELVISLDESLDHVTVDPGQIEQVLMNLVVNARDAMPEGGMLRIETRNVMLDEPLGRRREDPEPGSHVLLTVTDTGCGMSEQTRARLFEPFFTTKEPGKGTGLGLSTAHGIVTQSGGRILASAEPGKGSQFQIYFPRATDAVAVPHDTVVPDAEPVAGSETILVVEDEREVLDLLCTVLRDSGYTIIPAGNGAEALAAVDRFGGPIHLLVTDVVMPGMRGDELATRLRELQPETNVLLISGYADRALGPASEFAPNLRFLAKPFSTRSLLERTREILDERAQGPG